MTQAISSANVSGFACELAVLLLENEQNQAQTSRLLRDTAREGYLEQAQEQVDALHAAASAMTDGALVSASLTIASGACQMVAASFQFDATVGASQGSCVAQVADDTRIANALGGLASASGKLGDTLKVAVGDAPAGHHQAEAKRHETLAAQAQWQSSDAGEEIDKANRQADKFLELVQEIQRDQNSATNDLIGRI